MDTIRLIGPPAGYATAPAAGSPGRVGNVTPVVAPERQDKAAGGENLPARSAAAGGGIDREALAEAVARLNDHVQNARRSLKFSVDDVTGKAVITVKDTGTDEVIRQIPPEEMLAVARYMLESGDDSTVQGLVFRDNA